jgi:DNA (cytosine-5)-methyltransferase 1
MGYLDFLEQAFQEAQGLVTRAETPEIYQESLLHPLKKSENDTIIPLNQTVADGLKTIVDNFNRNKYLYSILLTSLVEKLVHPHQDIRYAQTTLEGGYSNRSTDHKHVTPFLKRHQLTHCADSGAESGRNFERPYPYFLNYLAKPQGKGNLEAFLGILHAVQIENIDPFPCLVWLMTLDIKQKSETLYEYPEVHGMTVQSIHDLIVTHFTEAKGNGRARLPVIAIQAIYQCLVPELARYQNKVLLPINRHTANDKKGWIGDIQVDNADGTPFEGVEIKSDKSVTSDMVRDLLRKFRGQPIDRYYILSTAPKYIKVGEETAVSKTVDDLWRTTGCEVIVNGLIGSLWYYTRLITNKDALLTHYTQLLDEDEDVKAEHRYLWATLLEKNKPGF